MIADAAEGRRARRTMSKTHYLSIDATTEELVAFVASKLPTEAEREAWARVVEVYPKFIDLRRIAREDFGVDVIPSNYRRDTH